jgi:hypothetical protein
LSTDETVPTGSSINEAEERAVLERLSRFWTEYTAYVQKNHFLTMFLHLEENKEIVKLLGAVVEALQSHTYTDGMVEELEQAFNKLRDH